MKTLLLLLTICVAAWGEMSYNSNGIKLYVKNGFYMGNISNKIFFCLEKKPEYTNRWLYFLGDAGKLIGTTTEFSYYNITFGVRLTDSGHEPTVPERIIIIIYSKDEEHVYKFGV